MNIRFLYIVLVASVVLLLGNCGTKRFITNDNHCTDNVIPKEKYVFDFKRYDTLKGFHEYEFTTVYDSKNLEIVIKKQRNGFYSYYERITHKELGEDTYYKYDSLGRLAFKHSVIKGVDIGEEIKFKYKDAKSREPIEVYRVNYDLMYPICWKEALTIAKRKGIDIQKARVRIVMPKYIEDRKYPMAWTLYDKRYIMDIDAYTGKITRFKKIEGIIYEE